MNCPTCQKIVATNAYNCPNCGHKFRSTPVNIFFKIILGILIISIIGLAIPVVLISMVGGVYVVNREELPVPNIVGKDFSESEEELKQLGLIIKKRTSRFDNGKPNIVLEQFPKSGEFALKGQTVFVVVSQIKFEEKPK